MLCHFESHHSTVNVCEERYQEILQIFWTNILCGQNHIPWHLVCVSCIDTMCLLNMTSGQSKPAKYVFIDVQARKYKSKYDSFT